MKKTMATILIIGLFCLFSCEQKRETISYKIWDGADVNVISNVPVSAVWVKTKGINGGEHWFPYKSFDSVNELQNVIHYLKEPEYKMLSLGYKGEENMVLYFSPPHKPVGISFSVDEWSRTVVFARGESHKLYKLLTEKEQRARYFGERPPMSFDIPVDAVWVIKNERCEWIPYKSFNSPDELMWIRIRFIDPENKIFTPDFTGDQHLVVFYLPPYDPVWMSFSVDEVNKEIVTKRGRSKELFKLFNEKPRCESFVNLKPSDFIPLGETGQH